MIAKLTITVSGDKPNVEETIANIRYAFITGRNGGAWLEEVKQP